ncbi:hypothetical protein [Nonomuraea cavernae]|uniref:hypothetical protein n=1 Tax=Nonomuraea cavernae TaxID=2045107 RepID=UPI00341130F2
MTRRTSVVAALLTVTAVTAGCTGLTYDSEDVTRIHAPQNDGANASVRTMHLRNAFLLAGERDLALYAILVNDGNRSDILERVTAGQGVRVRLPTPVDVPAKRLVGAEGPIATVTGVTGSRWVPMTFTLKRAGEMRVMVPIKERTGLYATLSPSAPGSPTPAPAPTSPAPSAPGGATPPTRTP